MRRYSYAIHILNKITYMFISHNVFTRILNIAYHPLIMVQFRARFPYWWHDFEINLDNVLTVIIILISMSEKGIVYDHSN